MFYGESMFAQVTDASKIALAYLVRFLKAHDVEVIDCQQETAHLASLGAAPITREAFITHMKKAIAQEAIGNWQPLPLFDGIR
jgi:leucyl/phenylalanyl-tRNA--protein transferase